MVPSSILNENSVLVTRLGPGAIGMLDELFIIETFEVPWISRKFSNLRGQTKYNCFESVFHQDPYYLDEG